jgi:hypothetical protein
MTIPALTAAAAHRNRASEAFIVGGILWLLAGNGWIARYSSILIALFYFIFCSSGIEKRECAELREGGHGQSCSGLPWWVFL